MGRDFIAAGLFGNLRRTWQAFGRDQSGNFIILVALLMPVLVGFVGLGTDLTLWFYTHQAMQSAAESAAVSAATAAKNLTSEANGVTAAYGFTNGVDNVTVTVNKPPQSGTHTATSNAVEVVVNQLKTPMFTAVWSSNPFPITARAVAVGGGGYGCMLALNRTLSGAVTVQGSARVTLRNCSLYDDSGSSTALTMGGSATLSALTISVVGATSGNGISATNGISTGVAPAADPYASMSYPSFAGCDQHNFKANKSTTIDPGVYCGGIDVTAGATLTLNPGIYYLDQGDLKAVGNATITGTGVTIVFTSSTSSNFATASISSNAIINLTAPTSGPTAGIVLFGDRNMPVGTSFNLSGGGTQTFGGAIYLPKGALQFTGGFDSGSGCTQIVADTISFAGNSTVTLDCTGYGTKGIGSVTASLVE